jgi:hypothetical protein
MGYRRPFIPCFTLCVLLGTIVSTVRAQESGSTVVLPLRTIGVSDTTAAVVADLIRDELEARRVSVLPESQLPPDLPKGAEACAEAACAAAAAANLGASRAVYGSVSRLGVKFIVRIRTIRPGETSPEYNDQLTATYEEDLDALAPPTASSPDWRIRKPPASRTSPKRSNRASAPARAVSGCGPFPVATQLWRRRASTTALLVHASREFLVDRRHLGFAWHDDTISGPSWTFSWRGSSAAATLRRIWARELACTRSISSKCPTSLQTTMIPTSIHRTVSLRRR